MRAIISSKRLRLAGCFLLAWMLTQAGCPGPDAGGNNPNQTNSGGSSGTTHVSTFTLPVGELSPVSNDLEIVSDGDVTIDGMLVADQSAGAGYNVTIRAEGDVIIRGTIQAGNAGTTAGAAAKTRLTQQDSRPLNDPGRAGGSVIITCKGSLTVAPEAFIYSGSGSDGAQGNDGGPGGKGGDVVFCVGDRLGVYGTIDVGEGGNGGGAESTVGNAKATYTNSGADSGWIYALANTVEWPGFDVALWAVDVNVYNASLSSGLILGGTGGFAGDVTLSTNINDCAAIVGETATETPATTIRAAAGGRGWQFGGWAGDIWITGTCSWKGLNGVNWEGVGGAGGPVTPPDNLVVGDCIVPPVVVIGARAGNGGRASVIAANGRSSGRFELAGGRGGNAVARGGPGGAGLTSASQLGGDGGAAHAQAGAGALGWPRTCEDPAGPGGDGGAGGDGEAYGGDGGSPAGKGGLATVADFYPVASGGPGGQGLPGGAGGVAGILRHKDGKSATNAGNDAIAPPPTITGPGTNGDAGETLNPVTDCPG
ncbi:MAG: hypothetical protein KKI02_11550 [Planctomycetes bacterium]|nr:hypothetical protein [Planctomycetota bacterium]